MRADFPTDFSRWKPDTPLWASCPVPLTVNTTHPPCPAAGRSPGNQLSVSFRWTWKGKGCCRSQNLWPVATASWSTAVLPMSLSDPLFIPRATGSWRGQEVKWPKTAVLGSFCQYWLFHIGFCSGAVAGKVWRDTHKMKLIFSMKAWLCWSCWEFWD